MSTALKTAAVGARGAIFVFTRNAGAWAQQAYLKASNAETGDSLGYAVAISRDGSTIAAGAADEDCMTPGIFPPKPLVCDGDQPMKNSSGATYVFVRSGSTWIQEAFFKASNPGKEDWFGARLALSGNGNVLAVGAQVENGSARGINGRPDDDAEDAGAVYFFTRTAGTWTQTAYVKASNADAYDEFGSAMALTPTESSWPSAPAAKPGQPEESTATRTITPLPTGAVYLFSHP